MNKIINWKPIKGLYEIIENNSVDKQIKQLLSPHIDINRQPVEKSNSVELLTNYISKLVKYKLEEICEINVKEKNDEIIILKQIDFANKIIEIISNSILTKDVCEKDDLLIKTPCSKVLYQISEKGSKLEQNHRPISIV